MPNPNGMIVAASLIHVLNVLLVITQVKMIRIAAKPYITLMQHKHPFRDLAFMVRIKHPVRCLKSGVFRRSSVTSIILPSKP